MFDLIELFTHWHAGRSQVQLSESLGIDRKTIRKYLAPAIVAGIEPGGEPLSVEQWAELVGPQIAAVTAPESVTPDGVLRVRVASAPWANELSLMAPKILARLNAGRSGRVKEIRWTPGPLERTQTEKPNH